MSRRLLIGILLVVGMAAGVGRAKVEVTCAATGFNAVGGRVTNRLGAPLSGLSVLLLATEGPLVAQGTTGEGALEPGRYRICAPHRTYDVRVVGDPFYASTSKPATTFANLTADTDFQLDYKLNMTVTPQAFQIPFLGSREVTWTIRSKAPLDTRVELTLDHRKFLNLPATVFIEAATRVDGEWAVWEYKETLSYLLPQRRFFATARGFAAGTLTAITETDTESYIFDNTFPVFGPRGDSTTDSTQCGTAALDMGGTQVAPRFQPLITTNPQPTVIIGACDPAMSSARSGLDPFAVTAKMCSGAGCVPNQEIFPRLDDTKISWVPSAPLALGKYRFSFTIRDLAGNTTVSPENYEMTIQNFGGSKPAITSVQPGNVENNSGIRATCCAPTSVEIVQFRAADADGLNDIVPGLIRLQIGRAHV